MIAHTESAATGGTVPAMEPGFRRSRRAARGRHVVPEDLEERPPAESGSRHRKGSTGSEADWRSSASWTPGNSKRISSSRSGLGCTAHSSYVVQARSSPNTGRKRDRRGPRRAARLFFGSLSPRACTHLFARRLDDRSDRTAAVRRPVSGTVGRCAVHRPRRVSSRVRRNARRQRRQREAPGRGVQLSLCVYRQPNAGQGPVQFFPAAKRRLETISLRAPLRTSSERLQAHALPDRLRCEEWSARTSAAISSQACSRFRNRTERSGHRSVSVPAIRSRIP